MSMHEPSELFQRILALQRAGVDDLDSQIWSQFGCERAVLVLDSTGFTRITNSHGIIHYLGLIARLREIVIPAFNTHGSLRCRAEADNIYAEFESTDQALAAAIAANRSIDEHNLMLTETEAYSLCIGIGFGPLLECGKDGLYGAEMNLASRLGEDTAESREILLTEAAWQSLPDDRRAEFDERFMGIAASSIRYYWIHLPQSGSND